MGKSEKYYKLKLSFDEKFKKAMTDYMKKNISDIKSSNPSKAYAVLKRLGARPGDCEEMNTFSLPSHANLSSLQSAERIAEHFSQISQEYPPIDPASLPDRVKDKLNDENEEDLPEISEYDVFVNIQKAKKPKTGVPGDIPKRLVQEFSPELSTPITKIFKNIIKTKSWPAQWKVEYVTPIQKIPQPETEDDLRNISLTSFFSKVFERLLMSWLLIYVGDKLDPKQYGGRKKTSITHYLIDMVNFILYNQDLNTPKIVLACMIDFSKAFNRINHNIILTKLHDLGVPSWLLKVIMGFLSDRTLQVKYKGATSELKKMPGGGPQGTILGMFLFIILINPISFTPSFEWGKLITERNFKMVRNIHFKYVDDLTLAETINLRADLEMDSRERERPVSFHERTGHYLPLDKCKTQQKINEILQFTQENEMVINSSKSKTMLFNRAKNYDFMPEIKTVDDQVAEVVSEMKLLGVVISSDLKWHSHVKNLSKCANAKLWILRRLKYLGANQSILLDVYYKQIRSILEYAAPLWGPGLTLSDIVVIERIQKTAFAIIFGFQSYKHTLKKQKIKSLADRRKDLCIKFAQKSSSHPNFSKWFQKKHSKVNTRSKNKLLEVPCRTKAWFNSPIPTMTRLINGL